MQRRDFLLKTAASLAAGGLVAACSTTASSTVTGPGSPPRGEHAEIDAGVDATLNKLYATVPDARELVNKASGMLVFPSVLAAGFGVGGQYGKGALRAKKAKAGYYSIASVSVGLQIGAQSKAIIILFMAQDALDKFRASSGWAAGVDASVALIKVGANGAIDASSATGPVLAFVLTNAGLMANLTLEGTKISPLK